MVIIVQPLSPLGSVFKIVMLFVFQCTNQDNYLIMAEHATLAPAFPAG